MPRKTNNPDPVFNESWDNFCTRVCESYHGSGCGINPGVAAARYGIAIALLDFAALRPTKNYIREMRKRLYEHSSEELFG